VLSVLFLKDTNVRQFPPAQDGLVDAVVNMEAVMQKMNLVPKLLGSAVSLQCLDARLLLQESKRSL
jgi:hypothetical protein